MTIKQNVKNLYKRSQELQESAVVQALEFPIDNQVPKLHCYWQLILQ